MRLSDALTFLMMAAACSAGPRQQTPRMQPVSDDGASLGRTVGVEPTALERAPVEPSPAERTVLQAKPFSQPLPLRPLGGDPVEPAVCRATSLEAFKRRLEVDAVWSNDSLAGPMNRRMRRFRIATHSLETLRTALGRYTTARTAALITYAGREESCAWVVSKDGVIGYGRSNQGRLQIEQDVKVVLESLNVAGASSARAPVKRGIFVVAEPAAAQSEGDLATALANLAGIVLPGDTSSSLKGFEAVIVVPDASLAGFPFMLLPAARAEGPTAYLIDTASIEVAPALGEIGMGPGLHRDPERELSSMTKTRRAQALRTALIVGDPTFADPDYDMPRLPGAEAEATAVAGIFGAAPLTGGAARLDAVETSIERDKPRYLHFATHGVADVSPTDNRSFVALAAGERFTPRVFALIPDGAIVVLSACQSGVGASRPGGVIGLPRALQLAGAQTVIMSVWNVDDAATSALMQAFAANLLETGRAPSAFAAAVRKTRKDYPDPSLWASFDVFSSAQP